jgi:hypothetical protein
MRFGSIDSSHNYKSNGRIILLRLKWKFTEWKREKIINVLEK